LSWVFQQTKIPLLDQATNAGQLLVVSTPGSGRIQVELMALVCWFENYKLSECMVWGMEHVLNIVTSISPKRKQRLILEQQWML
jgi:hypothetical protein